MNSVAFARSAKSASPNRAHTPVQLDQREKQAEERCLNEKQLRQRNATKIENIFKDFEKLVQKRAFGLEQRYQFLKGIWRKSKKFL